MKIFVLWSYSVLLVSALASFKRDFMSPVTSRTIANLSQFSLAAVRAHPNYKRHGTSHELSAVERQEKPTDDDDRSARQKAKDLIKKINKTSEQVDEVEKGLKDVHETREYEAQQEYDSTRVQLQKEKEKLQAAGKRLAQAKEALETAEKEQAEKDRKARQAQHEAREKELDAAAEEAAKAKVEARKEFEENKQRAAEEEAKRLAKIEEEKKEYLEAKKRYDVERKKYEEMEKKLEGAANRLRKFRRPPYVDDDGGVYHVPDIGKPEKSQASQSCHFAAMVLLTVALGACIPRSHLFLIV